MLQLRTVTTLKVIELLEKFDIYKHSWVWPKAAMGTIVVSSPEIREKSQNPEFWENQPGNVQKIGIVW